MIINKQQLRIWLQQATNTYDLYHKHRQDYLNHIYHAKSFHDMEITDPDKWHQLERTIDKDRTNFINAQHVLYELKHALSPYHKVIRQEFTKLRIYSRASAQEHLHHQCQKALNIRRYDIVEICARTLQVLVHNQNRYVSLRHFNINNPHGYAGSQDVMELIKAVLKEI